MCADKAHDGIGANVPASVPARGVRNATVLSVVHVAEVDFGR
jgi:hypothetical protein